MATGRTPFRFSAILAFPLAVLLAVSSLGGIAVPRVYAGEAPLWAAQGIGQDWVDLVVVAPLLAVSAVFVLRGSRLGAVLLGGALVYAGYSLVLYNFAIHFNPLFLVYASALGLAFYALLGVVLAFSRLDAREWFGTGAPARLAGGFAVLLGAMFYALWLSDIVPALIAGLPPRGLQDVGLITNPVHVLDVGIVLPAFIGGGLALVRSRATGYWLVPVMLVFGVLMDLALFGMAVSMTMTGTASGPPAPLFAAFAGITALVLSAFLRHLQPPATPPAK